MFSFPSSPNVKLKKKVKKRENEDMLQLHKNMIFSVTYYVELRNAIFVYWAPHFLPTMVE